MDCLTAKGRREALLIARSAQTGRRAGHAADRHGYVPENLLLFVAVAPEQRNRGLGRLLVERAVQRPEAI